MDTRQAFKSKWPNVALDDPSVTFEDVVHRLTSYTVENEPVSKTDSLAPLVLPQGFHDWVAYRLRYYEPTSGFARMIRGRSDDDVSAITLLFDLLQQFHDRTKRIVAKVSDTVVVVYTDDPGFFVLSANGPEKLRQSFCPTIKAFELRTGIPWSELDIVDRDWEPAV